MGKRDRRIIHEWQNDSFGFFYTAGKTLHRGKTPFQSIELVETREFGISLLLDGATQVVRKNEYQYHEPLVHPAMLAHPEPRSVLVIGGGDGGTLREVLRYRRVEHVDFVELDRDVVEFSRRYLPEISAGAFDDPRVNIRFQDGRAFVESRKGRYDLVIMDMTDPAGPSRMLYTAEFFRAVRESLRDSRGLFSMHTESPVTSPSAFGRIRETLRSVFGICAPLFTYIQMYSNLWSFAVASDSIDIRHLDAAAVDERIRREGLSDLKMLTGGTFTAMQAVYPYIREIMERDQRIITDADPAIPDIVDPAGPGGI